MAERSLEQVLAGTSEFLFPAEGGGAPVTIHSRSSDGDSPLHVVAWQNDVHGARQLIEAGADVGAVGPTLTHPDGRVDAAGFATGAIVLHAATTSKKEPPSTLSTQRNIFSAIFAFSPVPSGLIEPPSS